MLSRDEFQIIYDQGPDAVYSLLLSLNTNFDKLTSRVQGLENQKAKDSSNSSKPPSTDGPYKKPNPQSLRGKSGKPSGGQKGHLGKTLEFSDTPDVTVPIRPECCRRCAASLSGASISHTDRHQVSDIPIVPKPTVTEYQNQTVICNECGCRNKGVFPEGVQHKTQYGPNIKGLGICLTLSQLLPLGRACELLKDMFGASISQGTLQNWIQQAAIKLTDVETSIREALCTSKIVHFDETGLRVKKELGWLHVACTPILTYYAFHEKRGSEAIDEINILPRFKGRAIHDGLPAYKKYECDHGLCNPHLIRELIFIEEQHKQPWAIEMREHLLDIKAAVDQSKALGISRLEPSEEALFLSLYRFIVKAGYSENPEPPPTGKPGRPAQGPVRSLLKRFDLQWNEVLAFMYDFDVPFDNNQAERDIRMVKGKQKISGCFRSVKGAKDFCVGRGYISTMRKQGQKMLAILRQIFIGKPVMPALIAE